MIVWELTLFEYQFFVFRFWIEVLTGVDKFIEWLVARRDQVLDQ